MGQCHEAWMDQALDDHRATARAARRRGWWWERSLFTMTPLLVERGEATHVVATESKSWTMGLTDLSSF